MAKTHNYIVGQLVKNISGAGAAERGAIGIVENTEHSPNSTVFALIDPNMEQCPFTVGNVAEHGCYDMDIYWEPLFPEGIQKVWVEGIYAIPVELSREIAAALQERFSDVVIHTHYPRSK